MLSGKLPLHLHCEDETGARQFILRTAAPRVLAELFDEPSLAPLELGLDNGQTAVPVVWFGDKTHDTSALEALAREMSAFVDRYDLGHL